ncbi:MAG: sulfatase-like hydrolase/transferase [Myxococcaceae bacterium]|nr:sulfatase-like hydrolase/transferase [Myxococcaceae bacterium]
MDTGSDGLSDRATGLRGLLALGITDQQRTFQHFPQEWIQQNLPSFSRLQQNGLTFTSAITNTCRCSPSRAVLFTGLYPAANGVLQVPWAAVCTAAFTTTHGFDAAR